MKKIIFSLALVSLFMGVGALAAANGCTNPAAVNYDSSAVIDDGSCIFAGNGDPLKVVQPWGLDGYNTPKVNNGATVIDETGLSDTCPKWYPRGCFDLTKTNYYRNNMLSLARQLKANGFASQFPQFNGWYKLIQ